MRPLSIVKILAPIMILLVIFIFGSSCGNTREMIYMQGKFDTSKLSQVNATEPVIRVNDILSIIVFSDNPVATQIYNQSLITTIASSNSGSVSGSAESTPGQVGASPSAPGYQVDEKGDILFQGIGVLHVEGLTKASLKDTLISRLSKYLTHPYCSIRFLNYKFTVLGEVNRPGLVSIPGERINLLEAIALAGDLTFFGRRDNVQVIRTNNNKREFARLDLTKPEIMASPYFYLQQNDVVIIEPTRKKIAANDQVVIRNISLAASLISVFAVVYSVLKK